MITRPLKGNLWVPTLWILLVACESSSADGEDAGAATQDVHTEPANGDATDVGDNEERAIIRIAPTYPDREAFEQAKDDPDIRRANSLAWLDAVQAAVDSAEERTTILFEAGIHDASAIVNLDNRQCEWDFYNGTPPVYELGETVECANDLECPLATVCGEEGTCEPTECQKFGPYTMQTMWTRHAFAHGIVVLGKDDLTLTGEPGADGSRATVIVGNEAAPIVEEPLGNAHPFWYNLVFNVGGGSRLVTIEHLQFELTNVQASSHYEHFNLDPASNDDLPHTTDPAFAGGTTDLRIQDNGLLGIALAPCCQFAVTGRHGDPVIQRNELEFAVILVAGERAVGGGEPETVVNARVSENRLQPGIIKAWTAFTRGGRIESNVVDNRDLSEAGVPAMEVSGADWELVGNEVRNAFFGLRLGGHALVDVSVTDNRFLDNQAHVLFADRLPGTDVGFFPQRFGGQITHNELSGAVIASVAPTDNFVASNLHARLDRNYWGYDACEPDGGFRLSDTHLDFDIIGDCEPSITPLVDTSEAGAFCGPETRDPAFDPLCLLDVPGRFVARGSNGEAQLEVGFDYDGDYDADGGLVRAMEYTGMLSDDPGDAIIDAFSTCRVELDLARPDGGITDCVGLNVHVVQVPAGTDLVRIALFADATDAYDLDLAVLDSDFELVNTSTDVASNELVDVRGPTDTHYLALVHGSETGVERAEYTLFAWLDPFEGVANLGISQAPDTVTVGTTQEVVAEWQALETGRWLGAVRHIVNGAPIRSTHLSVTVP